jgi:hypothetical protein
VIMNIIVFKDNFSPMGFIFKYIFNLFLEK